jgi:B9 domain-containing protein 1
MEYGLSQYGAKTFVSEAKTITWSFPLEISFRSTNAHGWPRLVITVFGPDILGRDVLRGYGSISVPVSSGTFTKYINLFSPISTTVMNEWGGILRGDRTEFKDSLFVSKSEGRQGKLVE